MFYVTAAGETHSAGNTTDTNLTMSDLSDVCSVFVVAYGGDYTSEHTLPSARICLNSESVFMCFVNVCNNKVLEMECCSNDTIFPTTTTGIAMTMSYCINVTSTSTALCGTTVTSCPTLNITTVISTNFNTITNYITSSCYSQLDATSPTLCSTMVDSAINDAGFVIAGFFAIILLLIVLLVLSVSVNVVILVKRKRY